MISGSPVGLVIFLGKKTVTRARCAWCSRCR
jgi:hypothetical protein